MTHGRIETMNFKMDSLLKMDTVDIVAGALNIVALSIVLMANWVLGKKIKPISEANPTPITPPPPAFSIWGILYSLLITVCIAQFYDTGIIHRLSGWFILSCAGTLAWLLLYTHSCIKTSAAVLALTTACIGVCYARVQYWSFEWTGASWPRILTSVTFSLYFGWTLLATALNALQIFRLEEQKLTQIAAYVPLYTVLTAVGFTLQDPCIGIPFAWATLWRGAWMRDALSLSVGILAATTSIAIGIYRGVV